MLMRIQRDWMSHTLLVVISNGKITLESNVTLSYETKHAISVKPNIYTPRYLPKRNDKFMKPCLR